MFQGRAKELKVLETEYQSQKNSLVTIYGRRRVGKSSFINEFGKNKKHFYFFEGVEHASTPEQIEHFTKSLKKQIKDPILNSVVFKSWQEVFDYIDSKLLSSKHKTIICFDEFQWMAAGQSKLPSLLKYIWDNQWQNKRVMLILCGSIASYMVKKVIKSKALYGRISKNILLKPLEPNESAKMFCNKRSKEEILKYLLIFGGIPKYLESINLNESFNKNMNKLCFHGDSYLIDEPEAIFYSQFKESETYLRIVRLLQKNPLSYKDISIKLKINSGGSLSSYLENLLLANIISEYRPYNSGAASKLRRYKLTDPFLCFYYKFMEPNLDLIRANKSSNLFERLCANHYQPWMGYAFERFCMNNAYYLVEKLELTDEILKFGPYFQKSDPGFQFDLVFERSSKVLSLCEIKYNETPLETKLVPEFEQKLSRFKVPKSYSLEKILISKAGPSKALKDTEYFQQYLDIEGLLSD